VNGVPIGELEVAMETRHGHSLEETNVPRDQILDGLALREAMAQKAVALGLDKDEGLGERLARVQAQFASQRRKELAMLLYKREVLDKVSVTDQEIRDYYQRNQDRIRTELHVMQILTRDPAEAERAANDLATGKSFDEVAGRAYPSLPANVKPPWDLGFITWKNVPADWVKTVYGLAPGQTSDIIKGPGNRFWIVKLVGKRDNPEMTVEHVRSDIADQLKAQAADRLRLQLENAVRREMKVDKLPAPPVAAPPPPGPPAAPAIPP
jgi:parvulin-like peptidyl-prolyl isomerase